MIKNAKFAANMSVMVFFKKNILFTLKRPFHLMVAIMKHRANKLPRKIKAILATVSEKKTPKHQL